MKINEEKTKQMIFNFTNNFQFSTRTFINGKNIEIIDQTKLLGVVITNDLKWEENTSVILKKANARMQLLRKCATFTKDKSELTNIYILFIRSILEQSCVVWHSSLNKEDSDNLERIQKSAVKVILQEDYSEYTDGLHQLKLESLYNRRMSLCKNFAQETSKHEKLKHMFPKNEIVLTNITRKPERIKVNRAFTERYKNSAIPQMQRMLNESDNNEET